MANDEDVKKIMGAEKKAAEQIANNGEESEPESLQLPNMKIGKVKSKNKKETKEKSKQVNNNSVEENKAKEVDPYPYALDFELTEDDLLGYYLDDNFSKTFKIKDKFSFTLRVTNSTESLLFQLTLSFLIRRKESYMNTVTFNIMKLFIASRFTVEKINGEQIYKPIDPKYRERLLDLIYDTGLDVDTDMSQIAKLKNEKIDEFLAEFYENDLKPYINLFSDKPAMLMNIIGDTNAKLNQRIQDSAGDSIKNF